MEKNNKTAMCDCENCQVPAYRSFHRHFFLRWVLGLVILGLTFAIGFKLGEFKAMVFSPDGFDKGFGHGYFMQRGYPDMMYNTAPAPVIPSASTKSTTTK